MLAPLDRKLLRDLGRMKGQMVAVSLVMACGLTMMIMTRSLIRTLEGTRDAYYQTNRMADVFGYLKRAPLAVADRLAQIPGVAAVEPRVVVDVTLDLPGSRRTGHRPHRLAAGGQTAGAQPRVPAHRAACRSSGNGVRSSSARRSRRRTTFIPATPSWP